MVLLMYGHSPEHLLLVISVFAFFAAFVLSRKISRYASAATLLLSCIVLIIFMPGGLLGLKIHISENKSLVYYSSLPNAELLATRYSPLARLDIVQAPAIRYVPGLSIGYSGPIPKQILLISDADSISTINRFDHLGDLRCYDYITSALPYHLIPDPNVCVIGAGGGSDVAQALFLKAHKVTAVEMNSQTIKLLRADFSRFASGLYNRPEVTTISAEGRNFLQITRQQFDIIQISLLDSFTAATAGLYALNESHLYTVEAITKAMDRLTHNGLLSITRLLENPPRDSYKILATVTQALRSKGIDDPSVHIAMIRNWATTTIVASPEPLSESRISAVRQFCQPRHFDLVQLPGIEPNESNRFDVLDKPIYYHAAQAILGQQAEKFYDDYAYYIRPATDDKPYFFDFFKWKAVPHMIHTMPNQWLPYSEWSYLILIATLVQAICMSVLFIILPLALSRPIKSVQTTKLTVLVYFLLLGLAYMFLEMDFIQKMTLLIGHPVFGVAVTLFGFLVFSGCGSLVFERLLKSADQKVCTATLLIIVTGIIEINLLNFAFDKLIGFSQIARLCIGLILCAPLAFFMGVPFPTGLAQLHAHTPPLVPWAWAINGFASVTAAVLGTCLAISLGFTLLALVALAFYFIAAVIWRKYATAL